MSAILTIQTADGIKAEVERTPSGNYAIRYERDSAIGAVGVKGTSRCNYVSFSEACDRAMEIVLNITAVVDEPDEIPILEPIHGA